MINFERIDWNQQKSQILIGSTFSLKCMKHENKWKRWGKKVLPTLEEKNTWRNLRENDKNLAWNLRPIKKLLKSLKVIEQVKSLRFFKKTLYTIFDWSKNRFDWLKIFFFFFGKTGFKTSVFENYFISYSCILFIKCYALRTFYIKLLCFSKKIDFSRISIDWTCFLIEQNCD